MSLIRPIFLVSVVVLAVSDDEPMDNVTYSGYLVDDYCYGLVNAGGTAFDGSNPLKNPKEHSLHCLATPKQCRPSYYLAGYDPEKDEWGIRFRLDQVGTDRVLAMLDIYRAQGPANPRYCKPRTNCNSAYTVTARGVSNGKDGILRFAEIEECNPGGSPECDTVCNTTGNLSACGKVDQTISLATPTLVWLHVICMLLGWGSLLPAGVLWARNLRMRPEKVGGVPIWFQGHWIIQSIGWFFQLLGFIFIFIHKGFVFQALHERLGLFVVIMGSLQPLNAQLRRLACVGHPEHPGPGRFAWEILHKGGGYTAAIGGAINVVLGVMFANSINYEGALVPFALVTATITLGSLLIFAIYGEISRLFCAEDEKFSSENDSGTDEENTKVMDGAESS